MRCVLITTCGRYLLEGLVVLNDELVSELHALLLQKGKHIAAILLEESISKSGDAHAGFNSQAFSRYFLMQIALYKALYICQRFGISYMPCQWVYF